MPPKRGLFPPILPRGNSDSLGGLDVPWRDDIAATPDPAWVDDDDELKLVVELFLPLHGVNGDAETDAEESYPDPERIELAAVGCADDDGRLWN